MDVLSSGRPGAPEQAIGTNGAALSGLLEVQEEGQATLLLLVARGQNPASGRRRRNYRVAVKTIIGVAVKCSPQPRPRQLLVPLHYGRCGYAAAIRGVPPLDHLPLPCHHHF